jgi:hypothetical protein
MDRYYDPPVTYPTNLQLPVQPIQLRDPHAVFDFQSDHFQPSRLAVVQPPDYSQERSTATDPRRADAVFDFQTQSNGTGHTVQPPDYSQERSTATDPRRADAVFDFQTRGNGTSHTVHAQSLMMRPTPPGRYEYDQVVMANQQFAQHLDIATIEEQSKLMDNGFHATADLTSLFLQSSKLIEEHNYESLIMTYLTFSHTSNLMARNVSDTFKRSIISSLKLTDTSSICEQLQFSPPQQELVQFERRKNNVYGDYTQWEKILHVLTFNEDAIREYLLTADSDFGNDVPTIKFVLSTLQQVGAEALSMSDTLKLYLITNIKAVSSLVAVKTFLGEAMHATFNASDAANVFTACMADTRFTEEQFTADLTWFMLNVVICPMFTEKCIFFIETQMSMLKWSQAEETKKHVGRVRLRLRVSSNSEAMNNAASTVSNNADYVNGGDTPALGSSVAASLTSQLQQDSLQGWTSRARVPPSISHKSKLLGYMLMSQYAFADPSHAIRTHFVNDTEIADNILTQRICKPHAAPIVEFLRLLAVHVTQFDELTAFREECFADFSYTDSKDLSWLNFLQLYIAIYQHDDIWSIVWRSFCGILSHQVLIAIATFKTKYVYAVDKVVDICMRTEPSGLKTIDEVY